MVTIVYNRQPVLVTGEVAAFLEQDDRRLAAQARGDRRHLSSRTLDAGKAIITNREKGVNLVLLQVIRNLEREELRRAVRSLPEGDRLLVKYRYCDGLAMEEIGNIFGISKMAVSKRHKKLLLKLRDILSASFLCTGVFPTLWQCCRNVARLLLFHFSLYLKRSTFPILGSMANGRRCSFSGSCKSTSPDLN